MSKFTYMTKEGIDEYLIELKNEIDSASPERLKIIEQEIRQANEVLEKGEYLNNENIGKLIANRRAMGEDVIAFEQKKTYPQFDLIRNNNSINFRSGDENMKEKIEERAARLQEGKQVQYNLQEMGFEKRAISSANVAFQQHVAPEINPKIGTESALVDFVNIVPLPGGESYGKNYVKSVSDASYSTESGGYNQSDMVFDSAKTGKYWITIYTELPEVMLKTNPAMFDQIVMEEVYKAISRKLSREIIVGTGTDQLTGILNANSDLVAEMEVSSIDETTLDNIVLNYGGDEAIEGNTFLILNKKTLANFNAVRSNDGKKLYKIKLDPSGHWGTISSEETFETTFIINSALPAFSDAVADTDHFLVFGKPSGYELPLFSDITVERSVEYKFKEGMIAFRAGVYAGGTPAASRIFTKIKKVTG